MTTLSRRAELYAPGLGREQVRRLLRVAVYLVFLAATAAYAIRHAVEDVRNSDMLVIGAFALCCLMCAWRLTAACARDGMSLAVMFWFYNFFFLAFVPLLQYVADQWIYTITQRSVLTANAILFGYFVVFELAYRHFRNMPPGPIVRRRFRRLSRIRTGVLLLFGILAAVIVAVLAVKTRMNLWQSMLVAAVGGGSSPSLVLADFFFRPFIFFIFLFALLLTFRARRTPVRTWLLVLLCAVPALLLNSPTSSARFYVFTTYFALLLILYRPSARRSAFYLLVLVGGIFGSMLMHLVRQIAFTKNIRESVDWVKQYTISHIFFSGQFDGFENFVHALDFIRDEGIVWGRQLLGAILFWVPRSAWPDKPIGTAAFVASTYLTKSHNVGSTNIASPTVAEALINFGVPGVIGAAILGGWIFGMLDRNHQLLRDARVQRGNILPTDASFHHLMYPVLVSYMLFFLRGDMLSGMAYGCGFLVSFLAVRWLVMARVRFRQQPVARATPPLVPARSTIDPAPT